MERKGSSRETGTWQVTSTIMPGLSPPSGSAIVTVALTSCPPCPDVRSCKRSRPEIGRESAASLHWIVTSSHAYSQEACRGGISSGTASASLSLRTIPAVR